MLKANELIYEKIEHHIRSQIEGGALHAGDRMLSEREIAKQFKSSVVTVRKAMKPLIDSGIIEKIHGKGTFVKNPAQDSVETGRVAILYCQSREGLFASSFYMSIISGIEGEAASAKKNMMLRSLVRDPDEDPAAVVKEMAQQSDGLIIVDPSVRIYEQIEEALLTSRVPVVLVNNGVAAEGLDTIVTDNVRDTRMAVEFLAGLGHRRIACASSYRQHRRDEIFNYAERLNAYCDTMRRCGFPADDSLYVKMNYNKHINDATLIDPDDFSLFFNYDEAAANFDRMFEGPDPVTAVFCTSDERALFVYKLARRKGIRIPEDLSVIGYDDMTEAAMVRPGLTTIHSPLNEMGATAVKRLMEKIREKRDGTRSHYRITLPGKLIKRESHKEINKNKS